MKKIALATHNQGKIEEIKPRLTLLGYDVFTLDDFDVKPIEETGRTFKENALIKAKALRSVTNFMVLADDSGLEVDALNNRPGVYSSRYSALGTDQANNEKLLKDMSDVLDRSATFKTVMVVIDEANKNHVFEAALHGYIHTALEGLDGFGYDPLFIPVGHNETLASLGLSVKQQISHRKKCLDKVLRFLETYNQ